MTNAEQNRRKRENRKKAKALALEKNPIIENWCVAVGPKPTEALFECVFLTGNVYGDARFPPGYGIVTSRLRWANDKMASTARGSVYRLGTPSEEYLQYREGHGLGPITDKTFYFP
tara:strand:+ start:114 stop:461 length:348 start_codon:yes stop_codon:yes gene_type:complete